MKFNWKKLLPILFIIGVVTTGYASYTLFDGHIGSFDNVSKYDPDGLCKVTFNYTNNNKNETTYKYVKPGTILTTADVPVFSGREEGKNYAGKWYNIGYYRWKDNGTVVLDSKNPNLLEYRINKNTVLQGELDAHRTNKKDIAKAVKGSVEVAPIEDTIKIKEKDVSVGQNGNITNVVNLGGIITTEIESSYLYDNKDTIKINLELGLIDGGASQINNDFTIGLEDPTKSSPTDLVPFGGDKTKNTNYCNNLIKLSQDTIITANKDDKATTTFHIAARTGFWGDLPNWSQRNMQGFINGQYTELDLNGHNLIISSRGVLNALGVIRNSKPQTGRIIIENGGVMEATMVVEWDNLERALPVQYLTSGSIIDMYRMPYCEVPVEIRHGGYLKGIFRYDCGGKTNSVDSFINIVGDNSDYIIQTSPGGSVFRRVSYDSALKPVMKDFAKSNIMNQMIEYEFLNMQNALINPIQIKVTVSTLAKLNVNFFKGGLIIPPYLGFKIINSKVTLFGKLTFMPGTHLYVDQKSIIKLDSKDIAMSVSVSDIPSVAYQNIGGLIFVNEWNQHYEACNSSKGWFDDNQDGTPNAHGSTNGNYAMILRDADEVYSYLNQHRSAKCIMDGKFEFGNIPKFTNNSNADKFMLGGEINIADVEDLKLKLINRNDVLLYGSSVKVGPCASSGLENGGLFKLLNLNVSDYYISPLVSYGNVLMDLNNQGKIRNDYFTNKYSYDKYNGVVLANNAKYAFIHTNADDKTYNPNCEHLVKSGYSDETQFLNGIDSLHGKYFRVNYNEAGHFYTCSAVSHNFGATKNNYIFFRGSMMPFDSNTKNVYINKLRGFNSKRGNDNRLVCYTNHSFYNHSLWRIA